MAFYLTCQISIEGLKPINYVHQVEIESTAGELSDTCTVQLPNLKKRSEQLLTVGKGVEVKLGYDGNLHTEFRGYIVEVKPQTPFEIKCEDELYQLKRSGQITKSYESIMLSDLLKELLPNVELAEGLPQVQLDNFLVKNATKAQVLQELKEKYGLEIYYRSGVIWAGLPFTENAEQKVVKYHFQKNIVSENLTYQKKENVKIKVKARSILQDNSKIEVEVGDADGEQRSLFYYNITSEAELKKIAEADLIKYQYEGYKGSFMAFGVPRVAHSQVVSLQDDFYPDRPQGQYLVKSVKTSFGVNGFRREVELGLRV